VSASQYARVSSKTRLTYALLVWCSWCENNTITTIGFEARVVSLALSVASMHYRLSVVLRSLLAQSVLCVGG
jgi:hypothetical protein